MRSIREGPRASGAEYTARRRPKHRPGGLRHLERKLRADDGAAVAEFPMVAVLIVVIGLLIIQAALIVHTRNTLVDAAVQGAHHAALVGSTPQDGADRAERLIAERFGDGLDAAATASQEPDGTIHVHVSATLPLVGLFGPGGMLSVEGRALDEDSI
ncbi:MULTISPECIES: TadE/TadG family type IV pilus assembly protein [unclassified Brachybacterium]|uniref:TadE/TadG family type IV pilus assembly protein n=1 Tax=unclassified Brachybacterium TaxID=2623841 RepID=UPI003F9052D4